MTRIEQIAILQSIVAGKQTIQQAVATIHQKENSYFSELVGMDLAEYQDGLTPEGTIFKDGVPGKLVIAGSEIAEIYL